MEKVAALLNEETQDTVFRIEGPAGVGKTRMALEAITQAMVEDRTVYEPDASDPGLQTLLANIKAVPGLHAIIVVDECDRDRQELLGAYAKLAGNRLRLIFVGSVDVLTDSRVGTANAFVVGKLPEDKVKEALSAAIRDAPQEVIDESARLAGGYVKLAFFVVRTLQRNRDFSPAELRKTPDIRSFLKRFMDPSTLRALRALSLFGRLGWQDELRAEARAVCSYLELPFVQFQEGVKDLRDQGVVLPRGRYVYVSPELLAIAAAADQWETSGAELIEILASLPSPSCRRELLRRLATMGSEHQMVKGAVEKLLSSQGAFKGLAGLEDTFMSEAFRILSSASPGAAVNRLDGIIESASFQDLIDFKVGRRNVIFAIESLLRWPEASLQAARSLRALALAENETWGNNATGIFAGYFHINLSRSPIPLSERLPLVDQLLEFGDKRSRRLACKALAATLAHSETRTGGNIDQDSGRAYPPEWRPRTWGDVWDSLNAAVERLNRIAGGDDEVGDEARAVLMQSVYTLASRGIPDKAIQVLDGLVPRNDKERRQIIEACSRIGQVDEGRISEEQKERLDAIASRAYEISYFGRLRRWVGQRPHTDYDLKGDKGFQRADAITRQLAEEGYKLGISDTELAWLASGEAAQNVWTFGKRLGQVDAELQFFPKMVTVSAADHDSVLLPSYLEGVAQSKTQEAREDLVDGLEQTYPWLAFACSWRADPTERGLQRTLRLVEAGLIPPESLSFLSYGQWPDYLPLEEFARIVRLMLMGDRAKVLEATMSMLRQRLHAHPESLDRLEPLVWELLEARTPQAGPMIEWEWGGLAKLVAARDPGRMVRVIMKLSDSEAFVSLHDDATMEAFRLATAADSAASWNLIGNAMLQGDKVGTRLIVALSQWYGELIPSDVLISWAKAHEPRGPWIVARILKVYESPLPERARALVLAFPESEGVRNTLLANLESGSWVGPFSGRIESELKIVEGWARDPHPTIRSWAKQLVIYLKNRLTQQKVIEEEQEM